MNICVLDPGIRDNYGSKSKNLGDVIIQTAVSRELRNLFGNCDISRVSTHVRMKTEHFKNIRDCRYVFVGGSNLLGTGVFKRRRLRWWGQWKVSLRDAKRIRNVILLGVGWRQYEGKTGFYTRAILRAGLSEDALHSVRDEYTKEKLKAIGIENVVNTGCPATWPLANLNTAEIPTQKADDVLIMLTDYNQVPELDARLLKILTLRYSHVYCWPQGEGDSTYIGSLGFPVTMLDHSLKAIKDFLASHKNCDCIGTRLHGGIFCLLAKKRTLIIRVDNRATELSKSIGLPTVRRDDFDSISRWISGPTKIDIQLDYEAIHRWKKQFCMVM